MFGFITNAFTPRRDHADCSGCSLCLLVCPVWQKTRDISLTPHGRAKTMQHGEAVDAASVESCTLCMACDPVCPEQIDQVGKILGLRRHAALNETAREGIPALMASMEEKAMQPISAKLAPAKFLPDQALLDHPETLARILTLLDIPAAEDDGADIALAIEAGVVVQAHRLQRFLAPLRGSKRIIVSNGLLLKYLKQLLPAKHFATLGEVLSSHAKVHPNLRPTDLYVIEPRAFHGEYQRLVKYYDSLRAAHGCAINLDLQRIAIPAAARNLPQRLGLAAHDDDEQARWVLHGRNISRIVVESLEDRIAIEKVSDVPVVHLADLAES